MSGSLEDLIPDFVPYARELVADAGQAGLQPRITSVRRTSSEQARLYRRYLAGQSQLPAAPPGHSAHEYGYAFDVVLTPYDALAELGQVWRDAGGVWGPRDPVHFEWPGFDWKNFAAGGTIYQLADFLASFTKLGYAQIAAALLSVLGKNPSTDTLDWYLNHPAEAVRDLLVGSGFFAYQR